MRTLVPEPVPRVAARATTQPAARASTLAVGALATGSGPVGAPAAEPEPKKKRVAPQKAVQLPTASPEELELERLFAGRGAGAGAGQ